ncbi:MAG: 16S rRNA (cytidine(1402)-2'-O)-methyltransferase [Endomicrobium sp.]|uniref:16S rRNA (cytidine(1402)-2'-O)-methyltransferase n=1 Tax=Candidatus Endomicrobiellum pyrsonymphae TaxID=1408203 RepID=UPI003573715F|nr:16S rRNA (cytidine(1402)-2'-O)-methyltransferase [Endomicrobium sp.]
MSGILYIVPTPIGNLEDVTLRALRILKECDLIACEDTRRSLKFLSYFEISKPLISFYSYNEQHRLGQILDKMANGKKVALISDAGTPGISDPGYTLVKEAIGKGIKTEVLPGASAVTTALVGSGLPTDGFIFCGFLKRKPGKMRKELLELLNLQKTIVFYESPHRILKTVEVCLNIFEENARICLAREITKKFEEYIRGTIKEVLEDIKNRQNLLGEFVVLIYPKNDECKEI